MKLRLLSLALVMGLVAVSYGVLFSAEAAPVAGPGYTETPTFDKIPAAPIKGIANGRPFEAKSVHFEPSFGKWEMVIADQPLEKPTGFLNDAQFVNLTMPEPPAAGKKFTRKMDFGDGYFQIMQEKPDRKKMTSWNASNAWIVEFTKWDVKPYDKNGNMFQQCGTASGRVYVVYKGGDDAGSIKSSWVAGEFKDAVVRYMGEPEFKYETAPAPAAPAAAPPAAAPAPAAPAASAPAATAGGPGYTEAPTLDKIPNAPIQGVVNGRPFAAKTVFFEPQFGKWSLVVADVALPEPTALLSGSQELTIELPELPAAGKKLIRPMEYGDGFFQVRKTDNPKDLTSWNSDNAWAIEITAWDVKPYDENEDMFQVAGKASGRIYVVYKAGEISSLKSSWLAGVFTDAPVRYMGKPELKYE
jgi:hypothetical protein